MTVHSDRGNQYCSAVYQKLSRKHHLICSMSNKGDCYLCPVGTTMPQWKAETTASMSKRRMAKDLIPDQKPSSKCSNSLKCITIANGFTRNWATSARLRLKTKKSLSRVFVKYGQGQNPFYGRKTADKKPRFYQKWRDKCVLLTNIAH